MLSTKGLFVYAAYELLMTEDLYGYYFASLISIQ